MGCVSYSQVLEEHVNSDEHELDYVDPKTGLAYFKCGCIEDWS